MILCFVLMLSLPLETWIRLGERFEFDTIIPVAFVPLLGKEGWQSEDQFGGAG